MLVPNPVPKWKYVIWLLSCIIIFIDFLHHKSILYFFIMILCDISLYELISFEIFM